MKSLKIKVLKLIIGLFMCGGVFSLKHSNSFNVLQNAVKAMETERNEEKDIEKGIGKIGLGDNSDNNNNNTTEGFTDKSLEQEKPEKEKLEEKEDYSNYANDSTCFTITMPFTNGEKRKIALNIFSRNEVFEFFAEEDKSGGAKIVFWPSMAVTHYEEGHSGPVYIMETEDYIKEFEENFRKEFEFTINQIEKSNDVAGTLKKFREIETIDEVKKVTNNEFNSKKKLNLFTYFYEFFTEFKKVVSEMKRIALEEFINENMLEFVCFVRKKEEEELKYKDVVAFYGIIKRLCDDLAKFNTLYSKLNSYFSENKKNIKEDFFSKYSSGIDICYKYYKYWFCPFFVTKSFIEKYREDIVNKYNEGEKERLEEERLDKERLEKERLEKERLEEERLEKERLEKERLEKERLEKERLEKERLEKERLEKERLDKERLEKERLEKERLEKERLEKERKEKERLEEERLEKERLEEERLEKERLEKEREAVFSEKLLDLNESLTGLDEKNLVFWKDLVDAYNAFGEEYKSVEEKVKSIEEKVKSIKNFDVNEFLKTFASFFGVFKKILNLDDENSSYHNSTYHDIYGYKKLFNGIFDEGTFKKNREQLNHQDIYFIDKLRVDSYFIMRALLNIYKELRECIDDCVKCLKKFDIGIDWFNCVCEKLKKYLLGWCLLSLNVGYNVLDKYYFIFPAKAFKSVIEDMKEMRVEIAKKMEEVLNKSKREDMQKRAAEMERSLDNKLHEREREAMEEIEEIEEIEEEEMEEEEIKEKERRERKRLERKRVEKERLEKERLERIEKELEEKEKERRERKRSERERLERKRVEKKRLEKERLERIEKELEEKEKERKEKEKERRERKRLERERLERKRVEKEMLEKKRLEKERLERIEKELEEKSELVNVFVDRVYSNHNKQRGEKIRGIRAEKIESKLERAGKIINERNCCKGMQDIIKGIDNFLSKFNNCHFVNDSENRNNLIEYIQKNIINIDKGFVSEEAVCDAGIAVKNMIDELDKPANEDKSSEDCSKIKENETCCKALHCFYDTFFKNMFGLKEDGSKGGVIDEKHDTFNIMKSCFGFIEKWLQDVESSSVGFSENLQALYKKIVSSVYFLCIKYRKFRGLDFKNIINKIDGLKSINKEDCVSKLEYAINTIDKYFKDRIEKLADLSSYIFENFHFIYSNCDLRNFSDISNIILKKPIGSKVNKSFLERFDNKFCYAKENIYNDFTTPGLNGYCDFTELLIENINFMCTYFSVFDKFYEKYLRRNNIFNMNVFNKKIVDCLLIDSIVLEKKLGEIIKGSGDVVKNLENGQLKLNKEVTQSIERINQNLNMFIKRLGKVREFLLKFSKKYIGKNTLGNCKLNSNVSNQ